MRDLTWNQLLKLIVDYLPDFLQGKAAKTNLLTSIVFIVIVWVGKKAITGVMNRRHWSDDEAKLLWSVRTRNLFLLLTLFGLMTIWATELQTFALSAVAFAAALVVATKEIIMCVSGGLMRMTSEGFSIGDRIEVANQRGEVINLGFLTTTLLEIGPGSQRTGRAVVLPNSIFITAPLINESFTDNYVLHLSQVPIKYDQHWQQAERLLLEAAQEVCAPYLEAAHEHLNRMAQRHALVPSMVEPRVMVQVSDPEKLMLIVRFPTPAREKGRHEQEVLRRFLTRFSESKRAAQEITASTPGSPQPSQPADLPHDSPAPTADAQTDAQTEPQADVTAQPSARRDDASPKSS